MGIAKKCWHCGKTFEYKGGGCYCSGDCEKRYRLERGRKYDKLVKRTKKRWETYGYDAYYDQYIHGYNEYQEWLKREK